MVPRSPSRRPVPRRFIAVAMFALTMLSSTLADAAGCPTNLSFTAEAATNFDLGWLGLAHYTSLPGWSMRLGVDNARGRRPAAAASARSPRLALSAADGRNQRCSNDTSISCVDDAPCAIGGGHCAIYAAPAMTSTSRRSRRACCNDRASRDGHGRRRIGRGRAHAARARDAVLRPMPGVPRRSGRERRHRGRHVPSGHTRESAV